MKQVHIHFVCTGNYYRSRLAEAYMRSMNLPLVTISSSGVQSKENYATNAPISWYAARLAKRHNLIPHLKQHATQTTSKYLNGADIVVFMTDSQYHFAKSKFKFDKKSFEIWHIPDIDDAEFYGTDRDSDEMRIRHSEKTFEQIKGNVDNLVKRITHANRQTR